VKPTQNIGADSFGFVSGRCAQDGKREVPIRDHDSQFAVWSDPVRYRGDILTHTQMTSQREKTPKKSLGYSASGRLEVARASIGLRGDHDQQAVNPRLQSGRRATASSMAVIPHDARMPAFWTTAREAGPKQSGQPRCQ
jgi:hypothetical protein